VVKNDGPFLGQGVSSEQISRKGRVYRTGGEEFFLSLQAFLNGNIVDDVLLASVLDTNISVS